MRFNKLLFVIQFGFQIYLGETTSSELYAELSGTTRPSSMTLFTESVLIVFTSDSANSDSGFNIDYEVVRNCFIPYC